LLLRAIAKIRDEKGFRIVHIIGARGYERIVQEELFQPHEYYLAVKVYYEDRLEDEPAIDRLKENCWRRFGIELPSYEDYKANPDDPQWTDDEKP
jgi:hypothetical protein